MLLKNLKFDKKIFLWKNLIQFFLNFLKIAPTSEIHAKEHIRITGLRNNQSDNLGSISCELDFFRLY